MSSLSASSSFSSSPFTYLGRHGCCFLLPPRCRSTPRSPPPVCMCVFVGIGVGVTLLGRSEMQTIGRRGTHTHFSYLAHLSAGRVILRYRGVARGPNTTHPASKEAKAGSASQTQPQIDRFDRQACQIRGLTAGLHSASKSPARRLAMRWSQWGLGPTLGGSNSPPPHRPGPATSALWPGEPASIQALTWPGLRVRGTPNTYRPSILASHSQSIVWLGVDFDRVAGRASERLTRRHWCCTPPPPPGGG